jgi:hypothetical protein
MIRILMMRQRGRVRPQVDRYSMLVHRKLSNVLPSTTLVKQVFTFFCFDVYIQFSLIDLNKIGDPCTFLVTVNDVEEPSIICPLNIVANNDDDVCGATINYTPPVGIDNCSGAKTSLSDGGEPNTLFSVGITTNKYTVIDVAGNQSIFISIDCVIFVDKKKQL